MGKRKKQNGGGFHLPFPSIHLEVPERVRRMILSIAMFAFALIFVFAFFEKAGAAGDFLLNGARHEGYSSITAGFMCGRSVTAMKVP